MALAAAVLPSYSAALQPPPGITRSVLELAGPHEPGRRMVVRGRVYRKDRRTAVPNAHILVYQADASGQYGQDPKVRGWARLHGWMKTDSGGRYELQTIRPGAYSGAAHIHFVIVPPRGHDGNFELQFSESSWPPSPKSRRVRAPDSFATSQPVTVRDGVEQVVRNFALP